MVYIFEYPEIMRDAGKDADDVTKIVVGMSAILIPITAAGWLPVVAAAGAKLIASHKVGLTIDLLLNGVRGLKEGKAPKEIAKDMLKNAAISTFVAAPLEDGVTQWLESVQVHLT